MLWIRHHCIRLPPSSLEYTDPLIKVWKWECSVSANVQPGDGNYIKLTKGEQERTLKNTTKLEGAYARNKTWEGGRILPKSGIQILGQSVDVAHWMAEKFTGLPGQRWSGSASRPRLVGREWPAGVLMYFWSCLWVTAVELPEKPTEELAAKKFPTELGLGLGLGRTGYILGNELGFPLTLPLWSQLCSCCWYHKGCGLLSVLPPTWCCRSKKKQRAVKSDSVSCILPVPSIDSDQHHACKDNYSSITSRPSRVDLELGSSK